MSKTIQLPNVPVENQNKIKSFVEKVLQKLQIQNLKISNRTYDNYDNLAKVIMDRYLLGKNKNERNKAIRLIKASTHPNKYNENNKQIATKLFQSIENKTQK